MSTTIQDLVARAAQVKKAVEANNNKANENKARRGLLKGQLKGLSDKYEERTGTAIWNEDTEEFSNTVRQLLNEEGVKLETALDTSTNVLAAIEDGNIEEARRLLGKPKAEKKKAATKPVARTEAEAETPAPVVEELKGAPELELDFSEDFSALVLPSGDDEDEAEETPEPVKLVKAEEPKTFASMLDSELDSKPSFIQKRTGGGFDLGDDDEEEQDEAPAKRGGITVSEGKTKRPSPIVFNAGGEDEDEDEDETPSFDLKDIPEAPKMGGFKFGGGK